MQGNEFKIANGLPKEKINTIHENALYLIETVGLKIPHKGILKILSNYNGVKIEMVILVKE